MPFFCALVPLFIVIGILHVNFRIEWLLCACTLSVQFGRQLFGGFSPVNFRIKWLLCACMPSVQPPTNYVSGS